MVISVRHYAKRVKSAERTKLTKQIKRTKRKQGEDIEQTETVHLQVRTPANARRSQLAGGTATGDCSFAMFAFMAGFSIRFGRSVQEVGWRRQVRYQRRSKATQSTPCGGIVPVMTRSAPTPSRRTSADSPGASAYRSDSVQSSLRASSPKWIGAGCCGRSRMCRCRSRTARRNGRRDARNVCHQPNRLRRRTRR